MRSLIVAATLAALCAGSAYAQEVAISPNDTVQSVLAAKKGKRVTVRLRSGQDLTGVMREVTAKLVVIGAVSGREFFDAVIPLENVDAVLVRTKD